jgi:hypothetical protein
VVLIHLKKPNGIVQKELLRLAEDWVVTDRVRKRMSRRDEGIHEGLIREQPSKGVMGWAAVDGVRPEGGLE